ncbi:AEC family transporter [Eubacterium oxidoreducens]|nr:AEC family transporter [Eubacterium oxidoreducens]
MGVIFSRVFILFVLIFLGFYLGKRNILRAQFAPDLSTFILKVAFPATVFLTMIRPFEKELVQQSGLILIAAFIMHLGGMVLGLVLIKVCRAQRSNRGVWIFSCMFMNNGFMGFPLVLSLYGDEGLFLMVFANIITNFVMFSFGIKLLTKGYAVGKTVSIKKMFVNNINIAVVVGLIFYFFQIPVVQLATDLLTYVGNLTAGLSMIVVGLSLSRINLRNVFKGRDVWIATIMRLFVMPLLTILVIKLVFKESSLMMPKVLVLMSALPIASAISIISEQYGTNTDLAAKTVFVSTLCSLITIPLMMTVFNML